MEGKLAGEGADAALFLPGAPPCGGWPAIHVRRGLVEGGSAIKVKGGGTTQELKLVRAILWRMELPDRAVGCFSSFFDVREH
jgi:hypothetical protein